MSDWLREVEFTSNSIQYSGPDSETRPLLLSEAVRNTKCARIFWIIFLTILFCTGIGIGGYLIVEEDTDVPSNAPYVLMTRDGWWASEAVQPLPKYTRPLTRLALTQTSTQNCDNQNDCAKIVREIQRDHVTRRNLSDIAYNFIVAGDGATYEGRGWNQKPVSKDIVANQTLLVAFLGNFELSMPPAIQIEECQVLIEHALKKGILAPCFTLTLIKERPQDGAGQLVHVFNRLTKENNKRKATIKCL
ncbi:Peptidoglycan recognition protein SB1 [Carabus blaptoides fortunei]